MTGVDWSSQGVPLFSVAYKTPCNDAAMQQPRQTAKPTPSEADGRCHRASIAAAAAHERRRTTAATKRLRVEGSSDALPAPAPATAARTRGDRDAAVAAAVQRVIACSPLTSLAPSLRVIRDAVSSACSIEDDTAALSGTVPPRSALASLLSAPLMTALLGLLDPTTSRPSEDERLETLWIITNAAASDYADAVRAVLPAAPLLVLFCSSDAWQLAECAAWALGNLAADSEQSAAVVVAAGAVSPLVALLSTRGPGGRRVPATAAWALANVVLSAPAVGGGGTFSTSSRALALSASVGLLRDTTQTPATRAECAWLVHAFVSTAHPVPVMTIAFARDELAPAVLHCWAAAAGEAASSAAATTVDIVTPCVRVLGNLCATAAWGDPLTDSPGVNGAVVAMVDFIVAWRSVPKSRVGDAPTPLSIVDLLCSAIPYGCMVDSEPSALASPFHSPSTPDWSVGEALWLASNVGAIRLDVLLSANSRGTCVLAIALAILGGTTAALTPSVVTVGAVQLVASALRGLAARGGGAATATPLLRALAPHLDTLVPLAVSWIGGGSSASAEGGARAAALQLVWGLLWHASRGEGGLSLLRLHAQQGEGMREDDEADTGGGGGLRGYLQRAGIVAALRSCVDTAHAAGSGARGGIAIAGVLDEPAALAAALLRVFAF